LYQDVSLSVLSSIAETEKCNVGGGQQSCSFWSKMLWQRRKCETVRCRDASAGSFFAKARGEVFPHFHAVAVKRHSSMRNCLFGVPGRIFVNNPLDVKENDEYSLDFA
jgi:hypothetical protein